MKQAILFGIIIALYLYEYLAPLNERKWDKEMVKHGMTNFLMIAIATGVVKIFLFGVAYFNYDAFAFEYSLMKVTGLSGVWATIICLLIFDFAIWFQHLVFHRVPILWQLHKVHHADPFLDTTSGLRFHPIEILMSMMIKLTLVTFVGISQQDFALFEIILSGFALFNHSNIRLPLWLENILKYLIVTQRVHQVHHSDKVEEMHRNFGFNLVWWDRIFKTYIDFNDLKPEFRMGLKDLNDDEANSLVFLLKWPLGR
jgi:sterol desaturase/sphingolipid hydroxylase (fatty acid hydroxylase superfamily)